MTQQHTVQALWVFTNFFSLAFRVLTIFDESWLFLTKRGYSREYFLWRVQNKVRGEMI